MADAKTKVGNEEAIPSAETPVVPVLPRGANFQYVDEDSILEELVCSICEHPFWEPKVTACDHTFCQSCLLQTIQVNGETCPTCRGPISPGNLQPGDRTLQRLLGNLRVYCHNKSSGCEWQGPRSNLNEHAEKGCEKHPCPKSPGCAWTGKLELIEPHLLNECPFTEIQCPQGCGIVVARRLMDDHIRASCEVTKRREEEERWRQVAQILAKVNPPNEEVVHLNVRGRRFSATLEALAKFPGSLLTDLLAGRYKPNRGRDRSIFLDRDPDAFAPIFHWLTVGSLPDDLTPSQRKKVESEATFWRLPIEAAEAERKRQEEVEAALRQAEEAEKVAAEKAAADKAAAEKAAADKAAAEKAAADKATAEKAAADKAAAEKAAAEKAVADKAAAEKAAADKAAADKAAAEKAAADKATAEKAAADKAAADKAAAENAAADKAAADKMAAEKAAAEKAAAEKAAAEKAAADKAAADKAAAEKAAADKAAAEKAAADKAAADKAAAEKAAAEKAAADTAAAAQAGR